MGPDRRSAFRCSVQADDQPAIVRVGVEELPARVIEKSATGFGVAVEGPLEIDEDQLIMLATLDGRCLARVVHATAMEGGQIRLGLERSRELPAEKTRAGDWGSLAPQRLAARAWALGRLAAVFVACLVASTWAMSYVTAWWKGEVATESGRPVVKTGASRHAAPETRLATEFLRLDQLKSGELVKSLKLNKKQQERISGIVEQMTAALTALYETRRPDDAATWSELGLHVIQASWREIERELTPEQRSQWDAMLAEAADVETGSAPAAANGRSAP